MPSQFEKYRFTKKTVLSDETFNKIFKDIDLRITALEDIKKDWTGAVEAVTRYGLQRIEEVLRPNWEHINNKKTEADNLVAQIQQKRDNADAIINTSRDDVLQQIQTEKIQALNNIQASRTDAITAIQNAKTSALTEIQTAKNNALPQLDILAQAFQNDDPTTFIVKRALQSDTALNANTASSAQNADKVDGYHASQTPAPNTIPVAGDNGKISIDWLPQGIGSNLNADQVDGFHASQTPAPNVIPVSNDQSVIPQDFLPLFTPLSIPYSQLYIQSSAPTTPQLYDSWYNTNTNELFYWNGSVWIKVDWTKWVQNDTWYRLGKLRIINNELQISNNGTNWYKIFPSLGRTIEVIADDANPADNFKIVYLTVGQTLLVRGKNLARAAAIVPSLWIGNYYHTYSGFAWFGIFPSNIAISDGYGAYVAGYGGGVSAAATTSRNFVPIIEQAQEAHNWASFSIQIVNGTMTTASVSHGEAELGVHANIGLGTFPSNGYFLGSFCHQGTRINVDYLAITRQG